MAAVLFALAGGASCHGGGGTTPADAGMDEAPGDATDADTDAGAPPLWLGVIGTGQSLSVGAASNLQSFAPSAHNLKLSLGARAAAWPIDPGDPELSLVPLAEPIRALAPCCSLPYPTNIYGETFHTAMGTQLTALHQAAAGADLVSVHTVAGQGAASITIIEKNGTGNAYAASLFEATAIARLAAAAGARYEIGAVVLTHGEQDATRPSYEDDIARLAADYAQDLKAVTGQTRPIPMIVSQQHEAPPTGLPLSAQAAWRAGVDHPGQIVCAGPKYQYTYAGDHVHLNADQYDRLGAKYAQVFYEIAVAGRDWQPLQPIAATLGADGQSVDVKFHVPVPPLAWDETLPAPHQGAHPAWKAGRGFEVADAQGEVDITGVVIDGDTVHVALDRAPVAAAGQPVVVRYAMTQDATGAAGGLAVGRIGQLRDSDPLIAADAVEIDCNVTAGAAAVSSVTPGAFKTRSPRDVVEDTAGTGLPPDTALMALGTDGTNTNATLSAPWAGATGTARLRVRTNQRNYAVAFEWPLP
jgi:hypothetical protein